MVENTYLIARQMAQDLVRSKVEPSLVAKGLSYLRAHKEEGGEVLLAALQQQATSQANGDGSVSPNPLLEAYNTYLSPLKDDVNAMIDVLGWGVGFMQYYRGEGNRPQPNRRPSEPRRRRPPRQTREEQAVTVPMASLREGQPLKGVVRRIMPYGVFVSVGAERDGLVHVSEMRDGFTGNPAELVNLNDTIDVWVKSIDLEKQRISLTMKNMQAPSPKAPQPRSEPPKASQPRPEPREAQESRPESREPQEQKARRPRRRAESKPSNGVRVFEDETPKEMTALGEALRLALEAQRAAEEKEKSRPRKKEQRQPSEELAEAHRRTLLG